MQRVHRIVLLVALVALAPVLAGCEDFDPDKLDFFHLNEKKKLPGERKELFPGGVPGVTQGIPPEYLKENQPPADTANALPADGAAAVSAQPGQPGQAAQPAKTAAIEPAAEPKPKPKPKLKPKPRTASRPPTQVTVHPGPQQPAQGLEPWPAGSQPAQQQAPSPWPATPPSTAQAPWPDPPPPGTFSQPRN